MRFATVTQHKIHWLKNKMVFKSKQNFCLFPWCSLLGGMTINQVTLGKCCWVVKEQKFQLDNKRHYKYRDGGINLIFCRHSRIFTTMIILYYFIYFYL